ncbi:MAG: acyl-CoA dehydrogenase [Hyphomicrobiales bacterium]|nr:acyl-CoA dehydrogenase [Hyphomicrobiales bacterium]MCP5371026.1 acyl-CoA dehydrogenase [Hyphomicrobiales bacterium]
MPSYSAPVKDMRFALEALADYDSIAALPGLEEATWDVVDAVLEEAGKVASDLLAPLNASGDAEGARLVDGKVRVAAGWKEAYDEVSAGGWLGLSGDPEYGGQGLPSTLGAAVTEMWQAANLAFSLNGLLTQGAMDAIERNGSPQQKEFYLPRMMTGEWTGTMNLTEPQAGSDLAAIRTRAVPEGDHYRITGQKIFITYGDHEMTENIVHLVLARTPDAPEGVKGISLFVVPKFLANADGSLGERNDLRCVSLEEKLGIHASPTAVMSFGDNGGAVGYLVGEENRGLEYMFVMMNRARFDVGLQGLAMAERAYQQALAYARDRVQGKPLGGQPGAAIVGHPDVRRMLLMMKSQIEAMRGLAYVCAANMDRAARAADPGDRAAAQARIEFLTPIVKGWGTEVGVELTSVGVQVHGGMGFIEETGAAQFYRDSRITTIYEGTSGIQANDLVFRKVLRDGGRVARDVIGAARDFANELAPTGGEDFATLRAALTDGVEAAQAATDWLLERGAADPLGPAAAAYSYLRLMGTVLGGHQMARAALAAARKLQDGDGDADFLRAKIATARFYASNVMPEARMRLAVIRDGADDIVGFSEDRF